MALIDLVQPALPRRKSRFAMDMVSRERQAGAAGILAALCGLPVAERPLLFSVSGIDDLQADGRGVVDHRSPLRARPRGFGRIGLFRYPSYREGVPATLTALGYPPSPAHAPWAARLTPNP